MAEKTKSLEKTPRKTPEASSPSQTPTPSISPSGFGLADIQGAAGNMAMQRAAREAGGEDAPVRSESALNLLSVAEPTSPGGVINSKSHCAESPAIVPESAYRAFASPGHAIPHPMREQAEAFFAADLTHIRLHDDAAAATAAAESRAFALTSNNPILLSRRRRDLSVPAGKRTLIHELTHALASRSISPSARTFEHDAAAPETAARAASGAFASNVGAAPFVAAHPVSPGGIYRESDTRLDTLASLIENAPLALTTAGIAQELHDFAPGIDLLDPDNYDPLRLLLDERFGGGTADEVLPLWQTLQQDALLIEAIDTPEEIESQKTYTRRVLFEWQESQIQAIENIRTWTIKNWNAYFTKTGGRGVVPTNKSQLMDFFSGVWGNFYTDAPDSVLEAIGYGLADTAKAVGGAVVGLLVSSAVATVVEMCVAAFLESVIGGVEENVGAFSQGVEHGIGLSSAVTEQSLGKSDKQQADIRKEKEDCANALDFMSVDQIVAMRSGMERGIEHVANQASLASDLSLCNEHLRKWLLLHASGMGTSTDAVDPERYSAVLEEMGGLRWLEQETFSGKVMPGVRRGNPLIYEFQSHQARMILEGAGLEAKQIAKDLANLEATTPRWKVEVVDKEAFDRFVKTNWGVTPSPDSAESDYALVEVLLDNTVPLLGIKKTVQVLTQMTIEVFPGGKLIPPPMVTGRFGEIATGRGSPRVFKP